LSVCSLEPNLKAVKCICSVNINPCTKTSTLNSAGYVWLSLSDHLQQLQITMSIAYIWIYLKQQCNQFLVLYQHLIFPRNPLTSEMHVPSRCQQLSYLSLLNTCVQIIGDVNTRAIVKSRQHIRYLVGMWWHLTAVMTGW